MISRWLKDHDYNPDHALCITVGTDGHSVAKSNIMSVSLGRSDFGTMTYYIQGAEPAKVLKYTGVTDDMYADQAMGAARAAELIKDAVQAAPFIVSYNTKRFLRKWLEYYFPSLFVDLEYLDVIDLVKAYDAGHELLPADEDCQDVSCLAERLASAHVGMKGKYSFDAVCQREMPEELLSSDILNHAKIENLLLLWGIILNRE